MINYLIQIIDFKISVLNKMKRCLTGEAKMDKNYKRWRKDVKEWAKNR
tara:strand:+ start:286 stop:429 length:144 start_codon:yes stop_codon:yes gene_type:complete